MLTETERDSLRAFLRELKENQVTFSECASVEVDTRGFQGETPLKFAVVRQDEPSVRYLLASGADPNAQGEDDQTPLHHAAGRESLEIVRLLLAHGAATSILDRYGDTPIDHASGGSQIHALLIQGPNKRPEPMAVLRTAMAHH